ncbi:MAG: hypothetical protein P8M78_09350 [Myxococcota bacterium]|nr:hypothetical protein [Myxococcota bacterium]
MSPARGSKKKSGSGSPRKKSNGQSLRLMAWGLFAFFLGLAALWGVLTVDGQEAGPESSSEIGEGSREALRDILRDAEGPE